MVIDINNPKIPTTIMISIKVNANTPVEPERESRVKPTSGIVICIKQAIAKENPSFRTLFNYAAQCLLYLSNLAANSVSRLILLYGLLPREIRLHAVASINL